MTKQFLSSVYEQQREVFLHCRDGAEKEISEIPFCKDFGRDLKKTQIQGKNATCKLLKKEEEYHAYF